jgi:hypothetical protein
MKTQLQKALLSVLVMLMALTATSQEQAGTEITLVNTNNDWINLLRDDYLFKAGDDGTCLIAEIRHSSFVPTANNFRIQSRSILTYNPDLELTNKLNQVYVSSIRNFVDESMEEYTLNSDGLLASTVSKKMINNRWITQGRVSNTYTRSGVLERKLNESFRQSDNSFIPLSDEVNTIDADGSILVTLVRNYDARSRTFVPVTLITFQHNDKLVTEVKVHVYNESTKSFSLFSIETNVYDASNRLVSKITEGVDVLVGRSVLLEQKDFTYVSPGSQRLLTTLISKENAETGEIENTFLIKHSNYCQPANQLRTTSLTEDTELEEAITIYPNPGNELNVNINAEKPELTTIKILDVTGKIIDSIAKNINTGNNNILIDTETLADGTYFIQLQSEMGIVTKQWTKR